MKPTAQRFTSIGCRAARFEGKNGQIAVPSTSGPMANTVEDLVLYMKAVVGESMRSVDPYKPPLDFNTKAYTSKDKLRVGYFTTCAFFPASDPCQRAVMESVQALEKAGHTCVAVNSRIPDIESAISIFVRPS